MCVVGSNGSLAADLDRRVARTGRDDRTETTEPGAEIEGNDDVMVGQCPDRMSWAGNLIRVKDAAKAEVAGSNRRNGRGSMDPDMFVATNDPPQRRVIEGNDPTRE